MRKEPDERFQSAEDMLAAVMDAMTRRGYSKYDAMISYRNKSEAAFARGLYTQLSRAQIALERYAQADVSASTALGRDRANAEAYQLRAQARLLGGDIHAAFADIEDARVLDPENIDILLLRGQIVDARRRR